MDTNQTTNAAAPTKNSPVSSAAGTRPTTGAAGGTASSLSAAIGSAVGLGNIWRFPYVAYEGGGGYTAAKHAVKVLTATLRLELVAEPLRNLGRFTLADAVATRFEGRGLRGAIAVTTSALVKSASSASAK